MATTGNTPCTLDRVTAFVLPLLQQHAQHQQQLESNQPRRPFFLAISGIQGSGKSTLASALQDALAHSSHPGLHVACVSIDDFYLKKDDLDALSRAFPGNRLVSVRGPPGTHDVHLAARTMEALAESPPSWPGGSSWAIPKYDKGAFGGRGDRLPSSGWEPITAPVDVVILEGWCLGFQPLSADELETAIAEATSEHAAGTPSWRDSPGSAALQQHASEHLRYMNHALAGYSRDGGGVTAFTEKVNWDAFIHLDTDDLQNVYTWRWEQEAKLRATTGNGMAAEEVQRFIDNYMPAYHLYIDRLRRGVVPKGRQLRLVLDSYRTIREVEVI
ncbi:P-loop containing nucleoside triphosphate hydrolase protein [Aspergillus japonicus CBS 114.51]|uniref:P-loop containing nucleoside triphosphate hydrolase protein n=1 Tax=Aspergillus japonicus CBS 114.51 TaxID=1448312 RepID=A0A8T8XFX5_ASPJA|nr:P-loop containing nucleoside triphosphate hydrolase protein [Aspergillus japonicus CBS 114.51]RAH86931.1 P-loop containing nucleoside triphosphate hydrolase protein [Aspergillus japonicus CBS 114.51]